MKDTKKETKLVPKLRFKEFTDPWVNTTLGKTSKFSKGKNISKSDISEDGSTECIRYGELYTHYEELINEIISRTNLSRSDLILSETYDILIPASGETAIDISTASCVLKEDVALGGDINIIKTSEYGPFLTYYLKHKKKYDIAKVAQGNSVVHLYPHLLKSLKVHFPSITEQQKIATFLTAVDKRIEQLTKKKKLLEEYKKGVMQKIFNQEIRFKDENGNDFPDWEENLIENQFRFKQGVQVPIENQFQTPRNENFQRFIRIIDVTQPNSDTRYIEDPGSEHHISDNDIFMIRYGTPGVVAMGYVGVIANNLFRIIPKNKTLCKRFFYYLFKFSEKQFLILSNSTSMPAISFDTLKKLLIKVPSYKEQFNIATFLDEIEKQIEKHQGQITKLSEFKQGLLQQMFI